MATVGDGPEAVWLRVGDVASTLGVSANTVRRWTDAGRIAAHRSPGGHRRYLAEDVYTLLPEVAGEGAAQPGDFAELRRQSQDLHSVLQVGLDLMSLLADDRREVRAEAARALCSLTGAPRCDVYLGDGETLSLAVSVEAGELAAGRWGSSWSTRDWVPVEGDPATAPILCVRASDRGLARRARSAMQRRGCRSLAWAPMVLHGALVGALELSDAGDRDFSRDSEILYGLARICAEAVAIERTMERLAHRDKTVHSRTEIDAITDALTGLYDHSYLHERLSEELNGAHEVQRPLSVLFCDLDHFKGYNDAHGHSAGDAVLREVAHLIEHSVRNVDIAARYGGEEFVVLLVETDRDTSLGVAERIRERVRAAGFAVGGEPLTVSIGVAAYPDDGDRREDLLSKANKAMHLAKRRGRDQMAAFADD